MGLFHSARTGEELVPGEGLEDAGGADHGGDGGGDGGRPGAAVDEEAPPGGQAHRLRRVEEPGGAVARARQGRTDRNRKMKTFFSNISFAHDFDLQLH